MVFVNQKLTKYYSFNAHAETILILQKSVKRQLRFLSLSLAFTVQLCAMATEGAAREPAEKVAHVTVTGTPVVFLATVTTRITGTPKNSLAEIQASVEAAIASSIFFEEIPISESITDPAGIVDADDTHRESGSGRFGTFISRRRNSAVANLMGLSMQQYYEDGAGAASVTSARRTTTVHRPATGRPPRHPGRHQVRRKNPDGSPTRARVTAIKV